MAGKLAPHEIEQEERRRRFDAKFDDLALMLSTYCEFQYQLRRDPSKLVLWYSHQPHAQYTPLPAGVPEYILPVIHKWLDDERQRLAEELFKMTQEAK